MQSHDPVCGKPLHPTHVVASVVYGADLYHFCSQECHGRFWANPARYATPTTADSGEQAMFPVPVETRVAASHAS